MMPPCNKALQQLLCILYLYAAFATSISYNNSQYYNETMHRRAFSLQVTDNPQNHYVAFSRWPWPLQCNNKRVVRYCFADERSNRNLHVQAVIPAITLFGYAMNYGSLTFQHVGISLNGNAAICDPWDTRHAGALVIRDETIDGDDAHNGDWNACRTQASVGYSYNDVNRLWFCMLKPIGANHPQISQDELAVAKVAMAHELGTNHR